MSIVQFYKSQVKVGANLWPVMPGGGTLNWPQNHAVPSMAGNYWAINYIEGFQSPSIDVAIPLLDGSTWNNCPIKVATINAIFMTRTSDYQHDVTKVTQSLGIGLAFFDGFSGYGWPDAKGNSFSISGAKGEDVRFNCNFMLFSAAGTVPSVTTTPPDNTYPYFQGSPIRFQSLSFTKNGSAMDGLLSFNVNFSNNCSPDMSMVGAGPQSVLPVDINAGVATMSAQFVFQANASTHLANGDVITISITQNSITTIFTLNAIIVDDGNKSRNVSTARQLRTYNIIGAGTSNLVPPLTIA